MFWCVVGVCVLFVIFYRNIIYHLSPRTLTMFGDFFCAWHFFAVENVRRVIPDSLCKPFTAVWNFKVVFRVNTEILVNILFWSFELLSACSRIESGYKTPTYSTIYDADILVVCGKKYNLCLVVLHRLACCLWQVGSVRIILKIDRVLLCKVRF